jgi:hypothetical protein
MASTLRGSTSRTMLCWSGAVHDMASFMTLTSVDAVYTLSTVDFEWDAVNTKF